MSKVDTYVAKNRAIQACVARHPGASPQRIVELLAAEGVQVSPAQVIVVQTVDRCERAEHVAAS